MFGLFLSTLNHILPRLKLMYNYLKIIIMSYLSSINLTVVHFLEEKKKSLLREVIVTSLV